MKKSLFTFLARTHFKMTFTRPCLYSLNTHAIKDHFVTDDTIMNGASKALDQWKRSKEFCFILAFDILTLNVTKLTTRAALS